MLWIVLFGLFVISLIGVVTWITVHANTNRWYRMGGMWAFLASFPAMALAMNLVLGVPQPSLGVWPYSLPPGKHRVLGHKSVPKVGIFVLIDRGDWVVPSYYRLPWDAETSKKIEEEEQVDLTVMEGKGKIRLGWWDFSWQSLEPKVTKGDPPQIPFEPKNDPNNGPVLRVLPPAD